MKSRKNGQSLFAFIWSRGFLEHLTFLYNVHILVGIIRDHLYFNRVDQSYKNWTFHGEPWEATTNASRNVEEDDDHSRYSFVSEEIEMDDNDFGDFGSDPYEFANVIGDGDQPLYPGCRKYTKNDIDVYLEPLINDLKSLWDGIRGVYDAHNGEYFTLRAALMCAQTMWTINDFPAYGNLSGCVVKGYKACPICGDDTPSHRLKNGHKICYIGHRKWLPINHPYVLENTEEVLPYIEQHMIHIKTAYPKFRKRTKWLQDKHNSTFIQWLRFKVQSELNEEDNHGVSENLRWLAASPNMAVPSYRSYLIKDLSKIGHRNDQFVLASQVKQVFFVDDRMHRSWSVVLSMPNREYNDVIGDDVLGDVRIECEPFTRGMPNVDTFDELV
ncbi:unnamed protein product, partial [Prunus brigantina]